MSPPRLCLLGSPPRRLGSPPRRLESPPLSQAPPSSARGRCLPQLAGAGVGAVGGRCLCCHRLLLPHLPPSKATASTMMAPPSGKPGAISLPKPPVIFNGLNFREYALHMQIHMCSQRLWGYLIGDRPCQPCPTLPAELAIPADADENTKRGLLDDLAAAMEAYQTDLSLYETWLEEEAYAKAILVGSMEVDISLDIAGLASSELMWTRLRQQYEPRNDAMFLAVVNEAQSLRQLDATVDEFFRKMSTVWRQMDLQGADVCRTCTCCQRQRVQTETTRLYEFLSHLRPEFEPVRAQLLARRPRPSLLETLPELRAEETRCREAGIGFAQQSTSVLVAQGLPSQVHVSAQPVVVPSPLPVAAGAPSTPSGIVCGYCSKTGHTASVCYKKKRDQSRRTSQGSRQGSS
ncbi:hypothetical protein OsJ_02065 [Oryza sativa Japonica Group]|uniref:Uncharacterized protein n=1 Tax=Oryza sativa subsp. japonica TaxID=39947 RepID=A2ZTY5_ORYSJ|nr:hypothetical protein OsJ_02065 [Oryza sativa Japonica Group]KAF2950520.1 hypothetical protein DAI22_01g193550 [Oryza sativa Japonica Group]